MDPASLITGAVAAGAAAALKETAGKAVKDAYAALVMLIRDGYKSHSHVADAVDHLAKKPQDEGRRKGLESELNSALPADSERDQLLEAARALLKAVQTNDPDAARAIGVDIDTLIAAQISFKGVQTPEHGTGVRIREARTEGTASFENIGGSATPKP